MIVLGKYTYISIFVCVSIDISRFLNHVRMKEKKKTENVGSLYKGKKNDIEKHRLYILRKLYKFFSGKNRDFD